MSVPSAESPVARPQAPFVFFHIGDPHLDRRRGANLADLEKILDQIARISPRPDDFADFIYLPGDLAEDGKARQYALLAKALRSAPLPVHLIPGDHDRQHGTMTAFDRFFRSVMGASRITQGRQRHPPCGTADIIDQYYYAATINGVRCLFVDMVSAGYGRKGFGLDFRMGTAQRDWLDRELAACLDRSGAPQTPCAVFMHTYPADLKGGEAEPVAGAIRQGHVRIVEMGHTHYNELAHDGRTLYAAARSVGQNEDGSVGYAVAAIDGPVTSWRFRALDRTWPFVMITSPADRRIATAPLAPGSNITVRALVLSKRAPALVRCRVDDGLWVPMVRSGRVWVASVPWPEDARRLAVQAADARWDGEGPDHMDIDEIEPVRRTWHPVPARGPFGTDAFRLGSWLRKGVRGDQLGPNRNGRAW
ncbi:metallophosphoesterase family protein [Methylobacterium sp. A54F]